MTASTAAEAITCPMGEPVEEARDGSGPGCFCRIAKELMTRETDWRSLQAFCAGDPTQCPTLRSWRDAETADTARSLERLVGRSVPRAFQ